MNAFTRFRAKRVAVKGIRAAGNLIAKFTRILNAYIESDEMHGSETVNYLIDYINILKADKDSAERSLALLEQGRG